MLSLDQRLCPGVGGRKCGVFMSPLFRDPHSTCSRCRGRKCTSDLTCDICHNWSLAHWESFRSKRSYAGRSKSVSRHSSGPTESPSNPPLSPASTRAISPSPLPHPTPPHPHPTEGSEVGREMLGEDRKRPSVSPSPSLSTHAQGERERAGGGGGHCAALGMPHSRPETVMEKARIAHALTLPSLRAQRAERMRERESR